MFNSKLKKKIAELEKQIESYEKRDKVFLEQYEFLHNELTELYVDKKKAIAKEIEDSQYVYENNHYAYAYCKSNNKFYYKSKSQHVNKINFAYGHYANIFNLKSTVEDRTGGWQEANNIPADIATIILSKIKCE